MCYECLMHLQPSPCISILFLHSILRFSGATSSPNLAKANQQQATASLDLSHEGPKWWEWKRQSMAVLKFEGEGGEGHLRLQTLDNDLVQIEQCNFYWLWYMQPMLRPALPRSNGSGRICHQLQGQKAPCLCRQFSFGKYFSFSEKPGEPMQWDSLFFLFSQFFFRYS